MSRRDKEHYLISNPDDRTNSFGYSNRNDF